MKKSTVLFKMRAGLLTAAAAAMTIGASTAVPAYAAEQTQAESEAVGTETEDKAEETKAAEETKTAAETKAADAQETGTGESAANDGQEETETKAAQTEQEAKRQKVKVLIVKRPGTKRQHRRRHSSVTIRAQMKKTASRRQSLS